MSLGDVMVTPEVTHNADQGSLWIYKVKVISIVQKLSIRENSYLVSSPICHITWGVPQGSVQGPLLFLKRKIFQMP